MKTPFLATCHEKNILIKEHTALSSHCSFQTGGNAELFFQPTHYQALQEVLILAQTHHIPIEIIGSGSNILPPDTLLEGLIISMDIFTEYDTAPSIKNTSIKNDSIKNTSAGQTAVFPAGISITKAATFLANNGKRGLDFLYGMPGSIGGAFWMNARCYGKEISEVLAYASGLSYENEPWEYTYKPEDFSYKNSPFQHKKHIITTCCINIEDDDMHNIWNDMLSHEMDRRHKGHYIAPCAGSVFKNNKAFGAPSGKILDALQWRNKSHNDACVSPLHANIIINKGNASAMDIYTLSQKMRQSVEEKNNISLEYELIFLGKKEQWIQ